MPEDIMQKFEYSRENLTLATSPSGVIKEVRNILLLQQQFEISENKLLDLRIIQTEKVILELSNSDQVNQDTMQEINESLQAIKDHISKKEFENANELLRLLATVLEQIQI
jgi:mevalonate kinase